MEQRRALRPRLGSKSGHCGIVDARVIAWGHGLTEMRVDPRGGDIVEIEPALAPLPCGRMAVEGGAEALRIGGKSRFLRKGGERLERGAHRIGGTRRQALVLRDHRPGAGVGPRVMVHALARIVARIEVSSGGDQCGDDGGLGALAGFQKRRSPGVGRAQIGIGTGSEQRFDHGDILSGEQRADPVRALRVDVRPGRNQRVGEGGGLLAGPEHHQRGKSGAALHIGGNALSEQEFGPLAPR